MTTTETLDQLASFRSTIQAAQDQKLISSYFSTFTLNKDGRTKEELVEVLQWFLNGGKFTSYWKESVPYGERKNSRKRQKITWFLAEKSGVEFQLGHVTVKNYVGDFWEKGCEALVKNALCKDGEFSYYNNSFVKYVLENGVEFDDQGEKKKYV